MCFRVINTLTKNEAPKAEEDKTMTKKSTKTTFRMNGWIYTYNESMTSTGAGRKGSRDRELGS